MVEHGVQRRRDVGRRVRRVEEAGRRTVLKAALNILDIGVRHIVFIVEDMGWILDWQIGNIKHGNDDTAILEWLAVRIPSAGSRDHGGAVISCPVAAPLGLEVLGAIGH